jgi:hypothetical protein
VPGHMGDSFGTGIPGVMSTPVYGENLAVIHVAPLEQSRMAKEVARLQSASGWRSAVCCPSDVPQLDLELIDVLVLWGIEAGRARAFLAGRRPTVMILGPEEARRILSRPTRWMRESRQVHNTNLLLLPAEIAERYARWGPPAPLAHRPDGLPEVGAVTLLSAWMARAYAFGKRSDTVRPD